MKTKTNFKMISVPEDVHTMLMEDRQHFEDTIAGGKWSIGDVIIEYKKILNQFVDQDNSSKMTREEVRKRTNT